MKPLRHTLEASIKSGESKVQGKCIRGANKGITHITTFSGYRDISQMFISSNLIATLNGIQDFANLRVLSIGHNLIAKISELSFLTELELQNLSLEGNPITSLPFYRFHAIVLIPTLTQLDGTLVKTKERSAAETTIEFDNRQITQLCVNDAKLAALRSLVADSQPKDTHWLTEVQEVLGGLTLESFGLTGSEIIASFDQMRDVARECREKQPSGRATKWATVYATIEEMQRKAIDEVTSEIQSHAQKIRSHRPAIPSPKRVPVSPVAASESRNLVLGFSPPQNQTPLTQMTSTPRIRTPSDNISPITQPIAPLEFDLPAIAVRMCMRKKMSHVLLAWASLARPRFMLNHLESIIVSQRSRRCFGRRFFQWKCRLLTQHQRVGPNHFKLLERAQEAMTQISELEAQLENERRATADVQNALEQSVSNEAKLKAMIRKQSIYVEQLKHDLSESERKGENRLCRTLLEPSISPKRQKKEFDSSKWL
jgi:hypothetical protein